MADDFKRCTSYPSPPSPLVNTHAEERCSPPDGPPFQEVVVWAVTVSSGGVCVRAAPLCEMPERKGSCSRHLAGRFHLLKGPWLCCSAAEEGGEEPAGAGEAETEAGG